MSPHQMGPSLTIHIKITASLYPDFLNVPLLLLPLWLCFVCGPCLHTGNWDGHTLWETVMWLICLLFCSQWNSTWFIATNQLIWVEYINQWFIMNIAELISAWNQRLGSLVTCGASMLWFIKQDYIKIYPNPIPKEEKMRKSIKWMLGHHEKKFD